MCCHIWVTGNQAEGGGVIATPTTLFDHPWTIPTSCCIGFRKFEQDDMLYQPCRSAGSTPMGGSTFMLATSMWALGVWNFSNLSSSTFSSLGSSSFSQSGSTRRGRSDGRVGEYEIEEDDIVD